MMSDPIYAPAWTRDALCAQVDAEIFFPEQGGTLTPAKRICAVCPVTALCLNYALTTGERHGVFGGLSAYERRGMVAKDAA